jgi:hypothetical protein
MKWWAPSHIMPAFLASFSHLCTAVGDELDPKTGFAAHRRPSFCL